MTTDGYCFAGYTGNIGATIKDETETAFKPTTLVLYLYDKNTNAILNTRNGSDVLSSCSANGVIDFTLTAADNAMADSTLREEVHVARFVATWSSGTKTAILEVPFTLLAVPTVA